MKPESDSPALRAISRIESRIRRIEALMSGPAASNGTFEAEISEATSEAMKNEMNQVTRKQPGPAVTPDSLKPIIEEASHRTGIPTDLLTAVIRNESGFRADAVSPVGAMGLMQLMPDTARSLGVSNPFDARQNVMGGAEFLRQQLQQFGSVEKALAAYNAGPAAVQRYGTVPPYAETQAYVRRILGSLGPGNREDR